MKKKMVLMGIAGVLVLSAIIGGSLAGFNAATKEKGENVINTKEVSVAICNVEKDTLFNDYLNEELENPVPGKTYERNLFLENNSENGFPIYVRVNLYKTWGDKEGKEFQKDADADVSALQLGSIDDKNWIKHEIDDEQVQYYYKLPLQPGEKTDSFLHSITIDSKLGNDYMNKSIRLEITADAVQVNSGVDAISSAWGVNVTLDNQNKINNIEF